MQPSFNEMKAQYFEYMGNYQTAIELLQTNLDAPSALVGETQNISVYTSLGRIYQILTEYDKSEKMFKKALLLADDNAELFYEYSILKEKQGDMQEALDLIEKAYNLYKDGDRELELTQKIFTRYESFQEQLP